MYPYWETIIQPCLTRLGPRSIVEIGSQAGKTTRLLLQFCAQHDAVLHGIDPAPQFDVAAWRQRSGGRLVFHQALSHDALPRIEHYDAVLIDGDHNWYTVFHELKIIEEHCATGPYRFPLVMLHDVDWPYGRRDLYYNPDTIPQEHRHPYARQGILPGRAELVPQGGFNARLCNAVMENTSRNGVLTAVEDFIEQARHSLDFVLVPGFSGLGILFPAELRQRNPTLTDFLASWRLSDDVKGYVRRLEATRIQLVMRLSAGSQSLGGAGNRE